MDSHDLSGKVLSMSNSLTRIWDMNSNLIEGTYFVYISDLCWLIVKENKKVKQKKTKYLKRNSRNMIKEKEIQMI